LFIQARGYDVSNWVQFTLGIVIVALAAIGFAIFRIAPGKWAVTALFLLIVVTVAVMWGRAQAVVSALASAVLLNLLLIPPANAFSVPTLDEGLRLITLLGAALILGTWKDRSLNVERHVRELADKEKFQKTLLDAIAHDLKTPLTAVMGSLNIMLAEGERLDEGDRRELLDIAHGQAKRIDHVVSRVLEMTRLENGPGTLTRTLGLVENVLQDAVAQVREQLAERRCRTEIAHGLPPVAMDAVLLSQAFVNILENAAKFSASGTLIDIEASGSNGHVLISVADRGIGIPAGDLDRIFEKFYRGVEPTTPPISNGGTGLGLAIAKGIVEAHEGRIWAEQRAGGGTIIKVLLPISD
jgi:two-component system sensor histidine kinase KdpD